MSVQPHLAVYFDANLKQQGCYKIFGCSPTLISEKLRSGFNGRMFGAKFVQAAMVNCLQI